MELIVTVEYDEEARVWVAQNDVLGLATEADTMEVLTYKLQEMIPELVELNNITVPRPVAFTLVSHRPAVAFA
jgi:predicted RNase H-like HicB family nuclease